MICRYEISARAVCPVDGTVDLYEVVIESPDAVMVEKIMAALESVAERPIYQEDLTRALARRLGCVVMSTGYHSGVKTTVRCP